MSIPVIFGIIGFTSIYLMIEAAKIITTDTDTSNVLDLKLRTAQSLTGARLVMFIVVAPIAMLTERGWAYIRKDHVGPDG